MPFRIKCRNCKKIIYIEKLNEEFSNYPCTNCYSSNEMTAKEAIEFHNIEEIIEQSLECPNCNNPQNDNAVFCKDCGTEIFPKELVTIAYCDKCESEYDESYQFCEKDGNQLVLKKKEFDDKPDIETDSFIPNNIESKEQVDESLGFGWGNFAMVMAFLQGFSALGLFIADIQNEYLPERFLAFLTAAICLSGGLGLYQKRKYGLITIYIVQLINIIGGLIAVYDGDEFLQFGGIITIVISVLWGIYFKKREAMFT